MKTVAIAIELQKTSDLLLKNVGVNEGKWWNKIVEPLLVFWYTCSILNIIQKGDFMKAKELNLMQEKEEMSTLLHNMHTKIIRRCDKKGTEGEILRF